MLDLSHGRTAACEKEVRKTGGHEQLKLVQRRMTVTFSLFPLYLLLSAVLVRLLD